MNIEPDVKDGAPDDAYSQTRNYGNTSFYYSRVTEGSHYTSFSCFSRRSIEAAIDGTSTRRWGSRSRRFEFLSGKAGILDPDMKKKT